jgi:eukaryotic-like serine/threonine-protein kinase
MADWNTQANDIFLRALDIRSPEDRLAFLDSACTGNAGLRAQVESLLSASDQAGSFLESPASALNATTHRPPTW